MTDDEQILDQLTAVDLFGGLSGRDVKRLAASGRRVEHRAGHEIVSEGGGSAGFHLIVDGSASVAVGGKPRPELGPGQYFGEISLLDGKPRTATVVAGPDGIVTFSLTAFDFHALLDKHPELSRPIIEGLCARLRASETANV
jgi:CRP/FNR family cyclic AMP-dependent transcriptional regulator